MYDIICAPSTGDINHYMAISFVLLSRSKAGFATFYVRRQQALIHVFSWSIIGVTAAKNRHEL